MALFDKLRDFILHDHPREDESLGRSLNALHKLNTAAVRRLIYVVPCRCQTH